MQVSGQEYEKDMCAGRAGVHGVLLMVPQTLLETASEQEMAKGGKK